MKLKTLFFSILHLTLSTFLYAQSSGLSGTVYDATTGTTLPGASITIPQLNIGTITNLDGEYQLLGVPEGTHEVRISFVGYIDYFSNVEVRKGEQTKLDANLDIESIGINEVTVTAVMLGQAKAVNQQLSADAMVNVVSEDKIKELPDANAAEAIGRLPGISVQRSGGEANKVSVRGLEANFTNVTINGVKLAASGTDRSTDLSMISSEMLSGVEVYKSPTPDMDGESIGGTVNFSVRKAKPKPTVNVKVGNIYNSLRNDFNSYQTSAVLGKRFFDNKFGVIAQFNAEKINRGTDNVSGTIKNDAVNGETSPFWYPANKNSTWEYRKRYGGSLNLDYKLKNGGIYLSSFYSQTNRDGYTKKRRYYFSDARGEYGLNVYKKDINVLSNSISGEHTIANTKLNWAASTSTSKSHNNYDLTVDFFQTDATDLEIINENGIDYHDEPKRLFMPFVDSPEEVRLEIGRFEPDSTYESNHTVKFDWEIPFNWGGKVTGFIKTGAQYRITDRWRRTHEWKSEQYYVDANARERLNTAYPDQELILTSDGQISMANFIEENYVQDEFMGGEYDFYFPMDPTLINEIYEKDGDNWGYYASNAKQDEYAAYERLSAGYLMAKFKLFKTLTIIPGVRLEHSNNDYTAYETEAGSSQSSAGANAIERTSNMQYLVVLPHFHLKYKPVRWFDTRLAINKTVGRPRYNHVKPKLHYNPAGSPPSITAGNTALNPTLSTNYDLSVSFYKGTWGLFSAGVFYKDIKDHIYKRSNMMLRTDSIADYWGYPGYVDWRLTTYDNMDATAYGYELELQSVLKFLPRPLNGIVVNFNYSRQFTEALYQTSRDTVIYFEVPGSPIPGSRTDYTEVFRSAPMVDQTPHTFNFSIGYDYKGFSARFSTVYQSSKVSEINAESELKDIYTYKAWQLDASLKYTFRKRYSVFANFNNIANRADIKYRFDPQYFTQDKRYNYSIIYGIQFKL